MKDELHSDCEMDQIMFKLSNELKEKQNILITGGTGTLGKELLKRSQKFYKTIVYSRDELKQAQMRTNFPEGGPSGIRYFIGDVRDKKRLLQAMKGVDLVIHAAAMKRIETCEYNPQEAIQTNIIGSQNVCEAAIESGVKKCILVSTDKAPNASTLYGATKLAAERIFIASNNLGTTRFSVVRYGNVIGSRGSVFELWEKQKSENQPITITNNEMTRFFWKIEEAALFVLTMLDVMKGGEIFLPKMKGFKIRELAETFSDNIKEIGLRGIEKMHEILMTEEEARECYDQGWYYIVYPSVHDWCQVIEKKGAKVPDNFSLISKDFKSSKEFPK